MTKASDNAFPSLLITEGTEPAAPAAGKQRLYIDSTSHKLKATDSAGADRDIEGAALGAWTDYTPTWTGSTTNPTLGSTTIAGRYKLLDAKTVAIQISVSITTGGAWNAGSGSYAFSLPAGMTSATGRVQIIAGHVLDNGTTHYVAIGKILAGTTVVGEVIVADGTAPRLLQHNAPMVPATGDQYNLNGIIEIQ